jgi:hypothetical protein
LEKLGNLGRFWKDFGKKTIYTYILIHNSIIPRKKYTYIRTKKLTCIHTLYVYNVNMFNCTYSPIYTSRKCQNIGIFDFSILGYRFEFPKASKESWKILEITIGCWLYALGKKFTGLTRNSKK